MLPDGRQKVNAGLTQRLGTGAHITINKCDRDHGKPNETQMTIDFKSIGETHFPGHFDIAGEYFSSITAAVNGAMRNATFAMRWR